MGVAGTQSGLLRITKSCERYFRRERHKSLYCNTLQVNH